MPLSVKRQWKMLFVPLKVNSTEFPSDNFSIVSLSDTKNAL